MQQNNNSKKLNKIQASNEQIENKQKKITAEKVSNASHKTARLL